MIFFRSNRAKIVIAVICLISLFSLSAFNFSSSSKKNNSNNVPLESYCIDNGIKVEMTSASLYDNTIVAYLTLQDVDNRNRITNETSFQDYGKIVADQGQDIPLNNSNNITLNANQIIQNVNYNTDNQVLTVKIISSSKYRFLGDNIIFKASRLFSTNNNMQSVIDGNWELMRSIDTYNGKIVDMDCNNKIDDVNLVHININPENVVLTYKLTDDQFSSDIDTSFPDSMNLIEGANNISLNSDQIIFNNQNNIALQFFYFDNTIDLNNISAFSIDEVSFEL
jgi:hypothetical protein